MATLGEEVSGNVGKAEGQKKGSEKTIPAQKKSFV